MRTTGVHFKYLCMNMSNQSNFVILPNSFSLLSADPKNNGDLESELNAQHNRRNMAMAPPFPLVSSARMGHSQPPLQPASLSLPGVCYALILRHQRRFLGVFIGKRIRFPCLFGSGGGGGGERQQLIACHLL